MLFRLALQMGRTVEELAATISKEELADWQAWFECEPWGTFAADQHFRGLYQMLFSIHAKPNAKMPDFLDRDPETTARIRARIEREQSVDDKIMDFFGQIECDEEDGTDK